MKRPFLLSEAKIREFFEELRLLHENQICTAVPFSKEHIFTEEAVCEILGISSRTMRTYRNRRYFRYLKFEGRIYYLRVILYMDLLLMCQKSCDN